jgi:hypothetical protein
MTKPLNRNDSHVAAFYRFQAQGEADRQAARDFAAGLPFFFILTQADSYATVYDSDHDSARPVGTLTRPRLIGGDKLWSLAATDGVQVWQGAFRPSPRAVTNYLLRHAETLARAACRCENCGAAMPDSFYDVPGLCAPCAEAERAADLAPAPAIESGPVGQDWAGNGPAESFYAQAPALPNGKPGPYAFGPSEEAAREALARVMAPAPQEAPRPLAELLAEDSGAKAAATICRASVADLAAESGPFPRALTEAERGRLADLEKAADLAEGESDFRAAALAWAEGAKLCRIAGQNDSAALWEGHCRKAAGALFAARAAAHAAARKAAPKAAPGFTVAGFPACFRA